MTEWYSKYILDCLNMMDFFEKRHSLSQKELKIRVARAAITYIRPGMNIGVGTGSTVGYFIDELAKIKSQVNLTVSSSRHTTHILTEYGFNVVELNDTNNLDIYVDGADEATQNRELIKGGGGALTREKICRSCSNEFLCIIDESKFVSYLGKFPVPIEVIPMARSYVAREITKLGGYPTYRKGVVTDNGNEIIDVSNFKMDSPFHMENKINQIVGVVCNGIFASNPANAILVAKKDGSIEKI